MRVFNFTLLEKIVWTESAFLIIPRVSRFKTIVKVFLLFFSENSITHLFLNDPPKRWKTEKKVLRKPKISFF